MAKDAQITFNPTRSSPSQQPNTGLPLRAHQRSVLLLLGASAIDIPSSKMRCIASSGSKSRGGARTWHQRYQAMAAGRAVHVHAVRPEEYR